MRKWSKLTKLTCHLIAHSNQQFNQPLLSIKTPPFPLSSTWPPTHLSCSHNLFPPQSPIPQCIWHREQPAGTGELQDTETSAQPVTPKLCKKVGWQTTTQRNLYYLQNRNDLLQQYLWLPQPSLPKIRRSDWSSLWLVLTIGCTWLLSLVVPSVSFSLWISWPLDPILLFLSLFLGWLSCLLVWDSLFHLKLLPPAPTQPHMCSAAQHLPHPPHPSSPSFTSAPLYPSTTHSTWTRYG